MFRLYVIGIGYRPFTSKDKDIIAAADVILASGRLFDIFGQYDEYESVKERIKVINNVDETINFIKSIAACESSLLRNVVLLASGDPLFYGIGRRAIREFGKDAVEIIPDLSSIQLAFSKIKESWDDAMLISLHGGPDPSKRRNMPFEITDITALASAHKKIAILTDGVNNPSKIAGVLCSSDIHAQTKMFVCEKLGYPDEKITEGTPDEIKNLSFVQPNLVILLNIDKTILSAPCPSLENTSINYGGRGCFKKREDKILFGLSDRCIIHSGGLITKDEIRAVSLHKLELINRGVFWDIGAGSGSVSVEAARMCPEMKVFAVEKDSRQIENILSNKSKFAADNIQIIEGEAPDVFKALPCPQRAFIGGSGGRLEDIIQFIAGIKVEIVVINAATFETLNKASASLQESNYDVEVVQISASRMRRLGDGNYLSAINPVFIIKGRRHSYTK